MLSFTNRSSPPARPSSSSTLPRASARPEVSAHASAASQPARQRCTEPPSASGCRCQPVVEPTHLTVDIHADVVTDRHAAQNRACPRFVEELHREQLARPVSEDLVCRPDLGHSLEHGRRELADDRLGCQVQAEGLEREIDAAAGRAPAERAPKEAPAADALRRVLVSHGVDPNAEGYGGRLLDALVNAVHTISSSG